MPKKTGEGIGDDAEGDECKGETARVRGEEQGDEVNDKMNVEGDTTMEEAREKRKRG